MHENRYFVVPVNILTSVSAHPGLLGPHDTLPCVLILVHADGIEIFYIPCKLSILVYNLMV